MHTTERPTEMPDHAAARAPTGPIGRLTVLSMTTGAVAALVAALVIVSGGTEAVVTGAVLVAFGLGWALLAVLSTRRTTQPQRWARVPAVIMATAGATLIVLRPSASAMAALGWVWPIGLIGLAIWVAVHARRSMRSWARPVVLHPIVALMVVAAVGGAYETVQEARERSAFAMPGELVDVGGHRLHIHCVGTGSPTVVLEDGLGETSARMSAWIAPEVATTTRVCVYDRAGRGWSEPAPDQDQGLAVVAELHTLLDRHGEHGPYVLAGHSTGGVYVRAFAAAYPEEVAGLAMLDAQPATALTGLPGYDTFFAGYRKVSGVAPAVARFGLMRLVYAAQSGQLPDPQRGEERGFGSSASHNRSFRDELLALPGAMAQAQSLTTLGDKPIVVVTAEQDAPDGWLPLQRELVRLSTNSGQRLLPDVSHASLMEEPANAATAGQAITDVVQSVRTGAPLPRS